jgi:AcrR family transcriptional regulator
MGRNTVNGEKPRNRQQDILDAAIQLFSEKGIDQTSLDEIAEVVGVTKPTIYHYYRNKEAICNEIFSHIAFNAKQVRDVMGQHEELPEKLNAVACNYLKIMKTPPSLGGIILQKALGSMARDDDPIRDLFVRHLESRISEISRAVVKAEPCASMRDVRLLIAQMMHSLTNYWLTEYFLKRRIPTDREASEYARRSAATTLLAIEQLTTP